MMAMLVRRIDNFLNSITMYRLVLYGLLILAAVSIAGGFAGALPYGGVSLALSLLLFFAACAAADLFLSKIFKAPANAESSYITTLILFFLFAPPSDMRGAVVILLASAIAIASKYFIAAHKKHIFNPAAFAAAALGFSAATAAVWWVASGALFPFVLVLGLLIVRKIRKFDMFFAFLAASLAAILAYGASHNLDLGELFAQAVISWPLLFFATVMLTEPLTSPPVRKHRIVYGVLVGIIFGSQFHVGPVYPTPEIALVIGNIYAWVASYKRRIMLRFEDRAGIAANIYEFAFVPDHRPAFKPGQYLEWTLRKRRSDGRGNRRYFTIASSPTETNVRLGVKVPASDPSTFKQELLALKKGDMIAASQLAGDFTLPADDSQKLVFIAGGIGVTPFRSMAKWLLDTDQTRDIVHFYAALSPAEFAYKDIFAEAERAGMKTVYVLTEPKNIPDGWSGKSGFITKEMVQETVSDFAERTFYLSGPQAMVANYKKLLRSMGIPRSRIKTDYFPGF